MLFELKISDLIALKASSATVSLALIAVLNHP
jgi:hypothetical protein